MITGRPFSTISYNTEKFLKAVLDRLLAQDDIEFYMVINHYPEEDEAKPHWHVYVVPTHKTFNTNQFRSELTEFIKGESLPRRCMPCQSSKFQDWFLYSIHDPSYLASKGQARKFHYQPSEIITSDRGWMDEQIHQIDWSKINPLGEIIRAAESGIEFDEFLKAYPLPILQVRSAEFVFRSVRLGKLDRNGRKTHTPLTTE